eukprot:1962102-Prymnesium_polylepis.1
MSGGGGRSGRTCYTYGFTVSVTHITGMGRLVQSSPVYFLRTLGPALGDPSQLSLVVFSFHHAPPASASEVRR